MNFRGKSEQGWRPAFLGGFLLSVVQLARVGATLLSEGRALSRTPLPGQDESLLREGVDVNMFGRSVLPLP